MITGFHYSEFLVPTSPFGAYIRQARVASGKSLREVAEALSISHVFLGEVERGRRRILQRKYWNRLAKCIPDISIAELEALAGASEPIDPAEVEGPTQEVVVALARTLDKGAMSDDLAAQLLDILKDQESAS